MLPLIRDIKNLQKHRGLTDTQLAKMLSINLSTWSKIKNGRRPPGGKFIRALAGTFPEIRSAVMEYLSNHPGDSTNAYQTSQDGILGGFKAWWSGVVLRARKIWQNSNEP